ncbi:branched-chain alpha-keto acid dehydrogenase subunit E2 [hot springs metagenome]|uniref:Branched-chain alpha-keto acid dehydrogenase subunit E2 n=1 Tax=hot springs metagenome TaxID=433727 RepID=A0A5J4KZY6_9ZZZZ
MPFDFALPDLGEGITEGEIRKWLVKEGDAIEEHQSVLEIETDKAIAEVPSPKKGRVLKINKDIGDVAKVGEILMTIIEEGEVAEEKTIHEERPKSVSVVGVLPEEEEEILAAPAVRALAKELGVRLETIKGSGPGGSITKEDVIEASEKAKKAEDQYGVIERMPVKGLRRTIAKNLILSQKTTAFVTGMEEADITELWNLRDREKKSLLDKGIYLTFLPFFIKAVHHALVEHPLLNASVDEEKEEIIIKKYYNIGIAVDTPDGLMVPVIKDVDKKTILELAKEIQDLSQKARERKIKLEEMRGSTFTITNYGHFGGTFATPIINYPDVAILGTGKISDKPWIKNGQIVIRKILPLSLTFDHRVTDGVDSAKFLSKVIQYLEDPALLFIESA